MPWTWRSTLSPMAICLQLSAMDGLHGRRPWSPSMADSCRHIALPRWHHALEKRRIQLDKATPDRMAVCRGLSWRIVRGVIVIPAAWQAVAAPAVAMEPTRSDKVIGTVTGREAPGHRGKQHGCHGRQLETSLPTSLVASFSPVEGVVLGAVEGAGLGCDAPHGRCGAGLTPPMPSPAPRTAQTCLVADPTRL